MKEVYGVFVGGNNAAQPTTEETPMSIQPYSLHSRDGKPLVYAYTTSNWIDHNDRRETKYFVDHDGTVYSTGETDYSVTFDRHGVDTWNKVDALPEDASFIGNYHRPTV